MKPKDIEYTLSQLIDGTLEPAEAEDLRRRLAADPKLAAEFGRYQSLESILAALADDEMPEVDWDLQRQTIQAAMERDALLSPPTSTWRRRLVRWSAAGTAAAAVIALVLFGRSWLSTSVTPPRQGQMVVVWPQPAVLEGIVSAGPIRPAAAGVGELVVVYSEPVSPRVSRSLPISALTSPSRAGTIIISAGPSRPAPSDMSWGL